MMQFGIPAVSRICGTIFFGVKLDLRGNSAADPFMGGGFFCSPAACRREK
jgi:hypothetical protein